MLKKLISLCAAVALIISCAGCAKTNVKTTSAVSQASTTLKIAYNSSKYGDAWIQALADSFKKQNGGVNIELAGDAQLDSKIGYTLLAGSQNADIVFASKTNWQLWAKSDYMANLSAVYSAPTVGGETFSSKVRSDMLGACKYGGAYYIVPWGDGVAGLIYNKKLFEKNGWAIPGTMKQLMQLIDEIKSAHYTPFSWSGTDSGCWDSAVTDWWLQYEGTDSIAQYLKLSAPEVYQQMGRVKALKAFQAVATNPLNSVDNPTGIDVKKAVDLFYSGNVAMMPGGYLPLLETKYKAPGGFSMAMMKLPSIISSKQTDVSATLAGDFAFIPSGSKNSELAEKFLVYLAGDDALDIFTQKTGCPAPYNYNPDAVKGLDTLALSEAELWNASKKYYMYSDNPKYYNNFLDWPGSGSPLMQIFLGTLTPQQAVDQNYEYAKTNWDSPKK